MKTPALTPSDVGSPRLAGSNRVAGSEVIVVAGGRDIWETSDECHFAHARVSGDFTLTANVAALAMADLYTKAGLMLRTSLEAGAEHVFLLSFGDNQARNRNNGGIEFQFRTQPNAACMGVYPPQPLPAQPVFPANFPRVWLRLSRQGDTFAASHSSDGWAWRTLTVHRQALPAAAYIGLAVTSHNVDQTVRAVFRQVELVQP